MQLKVTSQQRQNLFATSLAFVNNRLVSPESVMALASLMRPTGPLVSLLMMGLLAADTSSGSHQDSGGRRWKREEDPELGTRPCHYLYYLSHKTHLFRRYDNLLSV